MSNATNTSESFVYGWTHGADTRGTYDIVWTSVQTIFLCSWVSVCVNIPAPNFGSWDIWRDKFHFVLVTVLGPELTFLLAFGQYQSARTSLRMFQESGFDSWTLSHAFYADMGGIHVQPESWERFPVNAKQLHYLVTHGYMDYPEISKEEIRCRGKADYVTRYELPSSTGVAVLTAAGSSRLDKRFSSQLRHSVGTVKGLRSRHWN